MLKVNELEEKNFIGGSYELLEFEFNSPTGDILLAGASMEWRLANINEPFIPVLIKNATNVDGIFVVELQEADTIDIHGKFIHQPVITDVNNKTYRPSQGIITITEAIRDNS